MEEHASRPEKDDLVETIGQLVVRWQDATQKHDEAVGEIYGLGPAERLCLSFLWLGPRTASAIAREVRLTPAAVTALVDRLERRGFVRRTSDPTDRRKVLVELAGGALRLAEEAYLPMQRAGVENLRRYSADELKLMIRLMSDMLAIQEEATRAFLAPHGRQ